MANQIDADSTPDGEADDLEATSVTNIKFTTIAMTETTAETSSHNSEVDQDDQLRRHPQTHNSTPSETDHVIDITSPNDVTTTEVESQSPSATAPRVEWQTPLFKCLKGNKKQVLLTFLLPILTEHKIAMETGNVKMAKTAVYCRVLSLIFLLFFWGAAAIETFTGSWHSRLYLVLFMLALLHVLGIVTTSLNIWRLRSAVAKYFGISEERYCERETSRCCLKSAFICFDLCALCQISTELDYQKELRRSDESFNIPMKSGLSSYRDS